VHEVVVLLGAEIEFQECYERIGSSVRQGLFESEFGEALAHLARFPHLGAVFRAPFHRLRLTEFPQALYYTVEARRVFIHAVIDTRQDLATIFRRLGIER
jgi:plasmid stabilization system protein ParE